MDSITCKPDAEVQVMMIAYRKQKVDLPRILGRTWVNQYWWACFPIHKTNRHGQYMPIFLDILAAPYNICLSNYFL